MKPISTSVWILIEATALGVKLHTALVRSYDSGGECVTIAEYEHTIIRDSLYYFIALLDDGVQALSDRPAFYTCLMVERQLVDHEIAVWIPVIKMIVVISSGFVDIKPCKDVVDD